MRRRVTLCASVGGLAALCIIAAIVLWPRSSRFTEENVNRIQPGMNRSEIETIIGPPIDDSTGPLLDFPEADCFVGQQPICQVDRPEEWVHLDMGSPNSKNAIWCDDKLVCVVTFDGDGRVCVKSVRHTRRAPQGTLDNLLWRAKRLWRHWFRND
jgi:hypothetical protein